MSAVDVRVPGAEKGQQRNRRAGRGARECARVTAGSVAAAAGEVKLPGAVDGLMKCQPFKAPFDSRLTGGIPATAAGGSSAGDPAAGGKWVAFGCGAGGRATAARRLLRRTASGGDRLGQRACGGQRQRGECRGGVESIRGCVSLWIDRDHWLSCGHGDQRHVCQSGQGRRDGVVLGDILSGADRDGGPRIPTLVILRPGAD